MMKGFEHNWGFKNIKEHVSRYEECSQPMIDIVLNSLKWMKVTARKAVVREQMGFETAQQLNFYLKLKGNFVKQLKSFVSLIWVFKCFFLLFHEIWHHNSGDFSITTGTVVLIFLSQGLQRKKNFDGNKPGTSHAGALLKKVQNS